MRVLLRKSMNCWTLLCPPKWLDMFTHQKEANLSLWVRSSRSSKDCIVIRNCSCLLNRRIWAVLSKTIRLGATGEPKQLVLQCRTFERLWSNLEKVNCWATRLTRSPDVVLGNWLGYLRQRMICISRCVFYLLGQHLQLNNMKKLWDKCFVGCSMMAWFV